MSCEHMHTLKRCFTEEEAAEYIGMNLNFLRRVRIHTNRQHPIPGPKCTHIRNHPRYLLEDLDAWLDGFKNQRDKTGPHL